jgi:hypothetical protein
MSSLYARRRPTAGARQAREIVSGWRTQAIFAVVQLQFSDLLVAKPMIRRHHVHARLPDIERIRPARLSECVVDKRGALTDLSMLARLGRRERSLQEYEALLDRTGFSVIATSRTAFELTPNVARHRAQSWAPLWSAVRRSHWSRNQTDG